MKLDRISPYSLKVWNTGSIIAIVVFTALAILSLIVLPFFIKKTTIVIVIAVVLLLIGSFNIIEILVISKIRYNSWYFSINEEMIIIKNGVIIKKITYIPMSRVQHVNTSQGPIMKKYNLREITINTSGGVHSIPCIEGEKALLIQETVANFAEGSSEENGL